MGTVLVTGGMGFIGRHVSAELLSRGRTVRVLDNLNEQVHAGANAAAAAGIELVEGDIRDPRAVGEALRGVGDVVHLAAEVGVGQSMYEIDRYVAVNELGTANLLQQMSSAAIRRLVVASSMSLYGEGLYRDAQGGLVQDAARKARAVGGEPRSWDPVGAEGQPLTPVPTPEWKQPLLSSVYALNKFAQEQMALIAAPAYGIEPVALRLFNVYGPGQALSNPYTGVLAIFAARLLNGRAPMIFEDGRQQRDFVHVEDVAWAFAEVLSAPDVSGEVINIGSGNAISIGELALRFAAAMDRPDLTPDITGKVRIGDIRHCFADISKAERLLGYAPRRQLEPSLKALAQWVSTQEADDRVDAASAELEQRGLVA